MKRNGVYFANFITDIIQKDVLTAAYIGASNGDQLDFYHLFEAAMENIGLKDYRMIQSAFSADDRASLAAADVILLAGGDVEQGWNIFKESGLKEAIAHKYEQGALLIGISAGAMQLGLCAYQEKEGALNRVFDTFQIVPYMIGVHEEKAQWETLNKTVLLRGAMKKELGCRRGAV